MRVSRVSMLIPSNIDGKLQELMRVFLAENANINLSALRTEEACWVGNIQDSLAILEIPEIYSLLTTHYSLLDLGTGGGFPLLPLAIAFPNSLCTGLDSTKKKIDAVGRIAKDAGITNIELIAERAEVLGRNHRHREHYDIVTSRAVAPINVLLEYCSPFVKVDGIILLWKSLHIDDELNQSKKAQEVLHSELIAKHEYELPLDFGKRQILVFKKTKTLNRLFPRNVGEAKKSPL